MKKSVFLTVALCAACLALGGLIAKVVITKNDKPKTVLPSIVTEVPGQDSVLIGGFFMPQGVPLALKDPNDLQLWVNTLPSTVNGRPTREGDVNSQGQLRFSGKILLLTNGQRAIIYAKKGSIPFAILKGGVSDGSAGWVPAITVRAYNPRGEYNLLGP